MKLLSRLSQFLIVLVLFASTSVCFANYKTVKYCIDQRVVVCTIGPYAYECEYTSQSCTCPQNEASQSDCRIKGDGEEKEASLD